MFGRTALALATLILTRPAPLVAQSDAERNFADESPIERDLRMQWWRDARFGMFIHWGLYAVPAGEWEGEPTPSTGEWIMAGANISVEDYEPLAEQFNPPKYDPAEWVRLARRAGQQYIVITSKHHDGFALFDSDVSEYDVVDATPYGRDLLAPLAEEARRQGVHLGFYYSIMDWHHPSQFVDPDAENPLSGHANNRIRPDRKEEYIEYMKAQLRELVTRYDPAILWFDGEWVDWWTEADGKDLYNYVRSLKEDIIINNRVGKGREGMRGLNRGPGYAGDFGTPEQEVPDTGLPGVDWESCITMNDTWGYRADDQNWKSADELIRTLVDVASKGGNFLLNVGPKADGTIPDESVSRLEAIGEWLRANGESIYMTEASPFDQPEWGRYTRRDPTTLYAHIIDWPNDRRLRIPAVPVEVSAASILTADGSTPVHFEQSHTGIVVYLPAAAPFTSASVVRLTFADKW